MFLESDGLTRTKPFPDFVCPVKRQSQNCDEFAQPLGVGQVCVLEAKPAGFLAAEEHLDFPAESVVLQGGVGVVGRDSCTLTGRTMKKTGEISALR